MFTRKAVFEFDKTEEMDIEELELELELIDFGLDEIESHDDMVYAYADYTMFGELSKAFEYLNIEIKSATLKRIATIGVEFSETQLEDIEKMLDKLEEDDDVQAVYTNIA